MRPVLPAEALKTFEIREPLPTHYRRGTCAEVGCRAQANGWKTTCDLTTALGLRQAKYIRDKSGRSFTYKFSGDGKLLTFTFPAGQRCFEPHNISLGRPALFVVRGNGRRVRERRIFDRGDQWMDTLHENTDRVVTARARG
jgi:hypothetical protein